MLQCTVECGEGIPKTTQQFPRIREQEHGNQHTGWFLLYWGGGGGDSESGHLGLAFPLSSAFFGLLTVS